MTYTQTNPLNWRNALLAGVGGGQRWLKSKVDIVCVQITFIPVAQPCTHPGLRPGYAEPQEHRLIEYENVILKCWGRLQRTNSRAWSWKGSWNHLLLIQTRMSHIIYTVQNPYKWIQRNAHTEIRPYRDTPIEIRPDNSPPIQAGVQSVSGFSVVLSLSTV